MTLLIACAIALRTSRKTPIIFKICTDKEMGVKDY